MQKLSGNYSVRRRVLATTTRCIQRGPPHFRRTKARSLANKATPAVLSRSVSSLPCALCLVPSCLMP
ncbi:hypothetical protein IF2G_00557 [Cordyceps javanica]|nr:hypothetical protein IF2G_00557 [Cordyceps javanica]